ncbi:MAG: tRNA (adenosine(37)-N6)-threonylcarbamoyltransferase complex ATPase subunit type 1 TsaE [Chlamydiae bacterium]|nr:tRNA (adenosine(37)-N6)-threonylcarbamoyltransferase complex ATPase subunit type 1 TsaE [Chlamydiota bacterium]
MDGRGCRRDRSRGRGRIITKLFVSELELKAFAKEFAKTLSPGDVVCLEGDLGAGKTTFVKGLASFFGIDEAVVSSPTFIYLNLYDHIAHFDLYRLQAEEQFISMGFDEYFLPPYITCVEWPNILKTTLPKSFFWIKLKHHSEGREISIEKRVRD